MTSVLYNDVIVFPFSDHLDQHHRRHQSDILNFWRSRKLKHMSKNVKKFSLSRRSKMLYILCCLTPIRPHENNQWIVYLAAPQAQSPPPSYNAIDLSFNGYNWTYNYSNDTSQDMTPCQGNCMDPCTQQCSMSQDCCCCDPNLMAQTQMAAAPLPAAPAAPVAPAYQQASQATLKLLPANFYWNTCGRCCGN